MINLKGFDPLILLIALVFLVACSEQPDKKVEEKSEQLRIKLQEEALRKSRDAIKKQNEKPPSDSVKDLEDYRKWLKETDVKINAEKLNNKDGF